MHQSEGKEESGTTSPGNLELNSDGAFQDSHSPLGRRFLKQ